MRIAALVHFAVPFRLAGSETVLHEILTRLAAEGHEVRCYATNIGREGAVHEGVEVIPARTAMHAVSMLGRWQPKVTFTHHDNSVTTMQMRGRMGTKVVLLVHNEMRVTDQPLKQRPDLIVWNSRWVKEAMEKRIPISVEIPSMVMHPPLSWKRHHGPRGTALTLVNRNEHKGAHVVYGLAEKMPDRRFIVVDGGHGDQVPVPDHLDNVEHWGPGVSMSPVWAETRVLLMPSVYESYGLVGIEAGCAGIPTIANPTPGLRESLGVSGIFADRDDLGAWVSAIERLDDPEVYFHASTRAALNSATKAEFTEKDLAELVRKVESL